MRKYVRLFVAVVIVITAVANLTGCGSKTKQGFSPAPPAKADSTACEYVVQDQTVNEFGLEDGKFEGDDTAVMWAEFQREYELAKLDAQNGGSVFDRGSWSDYWAIIPFRLEEAKMSGEAAQAAKMSLDILKRAGEKPSDYEGGVASELQLLAGVTAK
jgi:hypothetical protein